MGRRAAQDDEAGGTRMGERLRLPFGGDAPALARRRVRDRCLCWPEELLDDALLVTSELVTNAIRHGRPPVDLVVDLIRGELCVEVSDAGPGLGGEPTLDRLDARESSARTGGDAQQDWQESGRGLVITDAIADRWGTQVRASEGGVSVWFRLAGPKAP